MMYFLLPFTMLLSPPHLPPHLCSATLFPLHKEVKYYPALEDKRLSIDSRSMKNSGNVLLKKIVML